MPSGPAPTDEDGFGPASGGAKNVTIPVLPEVEAVIPTGDLRFIATKAALPRVKEGFDNWFKGGCVAQKRQDRSALRDGSKLALVIEHLRRTDGATIIDLTDATGWLRHTTRAALTGLRKRGYAVIREELVAGDSLDRISNPCSQGRSYRTGARRDRRPRAQAEDDASGVAGMTRARFSSVDRCQPRGPRSRWVAPSMAGS